MISAADIAQFSTHARKCNRILNGVHEACGPFISKEERQAHMLEDDYGGITGTIGPKHLERVAKVLATGLDEHGNQVLESDYLLQVGKSIFCDVGCGTGRPSFYFAGLPIKCSLGFDVDSLQVLNSCLGHQELVKRGTALISKIGFFKENALTLTSLSPVTHVYCFIGKQTATIQSPAAN